MEWIQYDRWGGRRAQQDISVEWGGVRREARIGRDSRAWCRGGSICSMCVDFTSRWDLRRYVCYQRLSGFVHTFRKIVLMHSSHLLVVAAMSLGNSVAFIHERHVMQMDSRTCIWRIRMKFWMLRPVLLYLLSEDKKNPIEKEDRLRLALPWAVMQSLALIKNGDD